MRRIKTSKLLLCIVVIAIALLSMGMLGCGVKNTGPLVVGMELQYPPFEMSDESGTPTGFSVDMAYALGEFLGREVVIENTAWTGLIPSLQTGKVDLVISSMTITPERAEVVDFSNPYFTAGLALLISQFSDVSEYKDLANPGNIVAVKTGTLGEYAAKTIAQPEQITSFQQVSAAVLEVTQARADAFIYDPFTVYKSHLENEATTKYNLSPIEGTYTSWGVAVKKGNKELLREINEFIELFYQSGGFAKLTDTYLSEVSGAFKDAGVPFFYDTQ